MHFSFCSSSLPVRIGTAKTGRTDPSVLPRVGRPGGHSRADTPVPIPNTAVKRPHADGTTVFRGRVGSRRAFLFAQIPACLLPVHDTWYIGYYPRGSYGLLQVRDHTGLLVFYVPLPFVRLLMMEFPGEGYDFILCVPRSEILHQNVYTLNSSVIFSPGILQSFSQAYPLLLPDVQLCETVNNRLIWISYIFLEDVGKIWLLWYIAKISAEIEEKPLSIRTVQATMGCIPFDLLILNVQLVNVLTAQIYPADIAIIDGEFAYIGKALAIHSADKYFDAEGAFAVPGYIDSHMHIESSMMTPANFARAVVPMGTTTVAADPHEIANVLGERGVQLLADRSHGLPLHIHIMAPSTIPSAPGFETSGANIGPDEVLSMLSYPGVLGLGEVMDFNGVISADPKMLAIIDTAKQQGVLLDGHVPTLRGYQLQAFIASGIDADHTYMNPSIVEEKLQNGMAVQIQERFFSSELMAYLNQMPVQDRIMLVTDDVPISRLAQQGHVDALLRHAVALGLDPIKAIRYVTINAANRLRLNHTGAIAPGYRADLVLIEDLSLFRALSVFSDGRLVAQNSSLIVPSEAQPFPLEAFHTMHLDFVSTSDFTIKAQGHRALVNVIMQDGRTSRTTHRQESLPVIEGLLQQDKLMKMTIFERHSGCGACSHGLIGNMEQFAGAIATSYAHDCHNLIVYSANDADAVIAANTVISTQGGVAAVLHGVVLASIALPIAGLLCEEGMDQVYENFAVIDRAAQEQLHLNHEETLTFITLMPLAVSPEIKLTDKGLLDVINKRFIPLIASCIDENGNQVACSKSPIQGEV